MRANQFIPEGRVKELAQDLKDKSMSDADFEKKYSKTRADARAAMRKPASESVAGPKNCWPGYRKTGTQPGTGKNAGKRVNDCEKIKKEDVAEGVRDLGYDAQSLIMKLRRDVEEKRLQPTRGAVLAAARELAGDMDFAPELLVRQVLGQGVAEGLNDTVGFSVNSEAAYQAVMARFGDSIDHDETSGIMYVPERMWPQVEVVAFDADGEGAIQADGLDEGSYDRDDYYNARRGSEYGRGLAATGYGGDGSKTRRDDIFKGQSKRLPADPFARTTGAVPTGSTGRIHSTAQPGEMDEGEKIGGRHDADDFDDMVLRLKKLAGSGPMKTVYDPDRRVYRNMPTAQQPAQQPKK